MNIPIKFRLFNFLTIHMYYYMFIKYAVSIFMLIVATGFKNIFFIKIEQINCTKQISNK